MRNMQNKTYLKLIVFILCLGVAALFVAPVFAADAVPAPEGEEAQSLLRAGLDQAADTSGLMPQHTSSVQEVIGLVVKEALRYLSILFIILMLYAGIRWMTAGGDQAKVKEARSWIINASIGFIVTLMAYQVVAFIIGNIQIEGEAVNQSVDPSAEVSQEPIFTPEEPQQSVLPEEETGPPAP